MVLKGVPPLSQGSRVSESLLTRGNFPPGEPSILEPKHTLPFPLPGKHREDPSYTPHPGFELVAYKQANTAKTQHAVPKHTVVTDDLLCVHAY